MHLIETTNSGVWLGIFYSFLLKREYLFISIDRSFIHSFCAHDHRYTLRADD